MSKYAEKLRKRLVEKQQGLVETLPPMRQVERSTSAPKEGAKHTRHTVLALVDPTSALRTVAMQDKPSPKKDFTLDSFAVTVVCHRPGKVEGQVELLAFVYRGKNGGVVDTTSYRFPTETAEQGLGETPEMVALSCLKQEVFASDMHGTASIGPTVRKDVRISDSARRPGPTTPEYLDSPQWFEASTLLDSMLQRGIRSHRLSFLSAMQYLAGKDEKVATHYASALKEWAARL